MKQYKHTEGSDKKNSIDTLQFIGGKKHRIAAPSDDRHHLKGQYDIGNFEWWYFDLIDVELDYVVKIVIHLGTDPLRRKFFPQLAVSMRTPEGHYSLIKQYDLSSFSAPGKICNIALNNDAHFIYKPDEERERYIINVDTEEFKCGLQFKQTLPGCNPIGNGIEVASGNKTGMFSWYVVIPHAEVKGWFFCKGKQYSLTNAYGYHDHNVWLAKPPFKLFMDELITHWIWGRFYGQHYSCIFADTYMNNTTMRSFLLVHNGKLIHNSNNLVSYHYDDIRTDKQTGIKLPCSITAQLHEQDFKCTLMINTIDIMEKRDLLSNINPFIGWFIKSLIARPAYFGVYAQGTLSYNNISIEGKGIYEIMLFRNINW